MVNSELLVKYGFIKKSKKKHYEFDKDSKTFKPIGDYKLSSSDANEEEREIISSPVGSEYGKTGFPKPYKTHRLTYEVYDLSLEEPYFWILETLRTSFQVVEKLEDSFAASENSAFFGVTQQRLGAQQDKISQFLATTGKMIKELFQMVRELRVIDERLEYYRESKAQLTKPLPQRERGAEITLKGIFVDLVQGGGKSAASVYGMARELEFLTLPDLFFDAPPFKNSAELENHVNNLGKDFNRNVLRVLLRHLTQFTQWKKSTSIEHENRKRFMLNYLEQHFQIINMYISWVKPYLRHVEKLTLKASNMETPDLISAFEGSMLDIELLAIKRIPVGKSGANGCVLTTFNYRTRPELKVVQEGYQRGPVHIGRLEVNFRIYGWSDEQVENYKAMKQKESILLMGNISSSVQNAMESLGDELELYLKEARDARKPPKEERREEPTKKPLFESLLGDFYTKHSKQKPKIDRKAAKKLEAQKQEINSHISKNSSLIRGTIASCWPAYHAFKKSHRMVTW